MQDLIDIIDIQNKRLSNKNGIIDMPYILSKQKLYKEIHFNNFQLGIRINRILSFEIIVLSGGNNCIAQQNLEVLLFEFLGK